MRDKTYPNTHAMVERLNLWYTLTGIPQRTRSTYENMTPNVLNQIYAKYTPIFRY